MLGCGYLIHGEVVRGRLLIDKRKTDQFLRYFSRFFIHIGSFANYVPLNYKFRLASGCADSYIRCLR